MVNWEAVERCKAKGWGWDRIARDPAVEFSPDPPPPDPGNALRQIYYRKMSQAGNQRRAKAPKAPETVPSPEKRWPLARIGYLLFPFFGIWSLLSFFLASPVGTYFPAFPALILFSVVSGFLLSFGLLRIRPRWTPVFRTTLVIGAVGGLIVSGGLAGGALSQSCPLLTPFVTNEPAGWIKLPNAPWHEHGLPVLFFYGSVACPYCSASSWAVFAALGKFGNLSGTTYAVSSSTDVFPQTPEVVLAGAMLQSSYVRLNALESTDPNQVTAPTPTECVQQAYVSAYDPGGAFPFVVVGGIYAHSGTLVDPGALAGLSPSTVGNQTTSESGGAWNALAPQAFFLMAFVLKVDGGKPASVAQIPGVNAVLGEIH
jgi:hypothetical protein